MTAVAENPMKKLQDKVLKPDFLSVSGSRLYGTNREGSDYDYRGFVLPPVEFLVDGGPTFKDTEIEGADHKIYSIRRFLELTLQGDPQCTELFYVPDHLIKCSTNLGRAIIDLSPEIVSNNVYKRIMGYGYSEWRKAMGQRLVIEDRTKTEDDIIADIRNTFSPDKSDMDTIVDILMKNKPSKLVPSKKNLGQKRKAEFENFGYGVSSAAHAIRLAQELVELMTTGTISFPRPNADFLRGIRIGEVKKEEAEKVYEESRVEAEKARDNSILRDKPDRKAVMDFYTDVVHEIVKASI